MISILDAILCAILGLAVKIANVFVAVVNALIVAIGFMISTILGLLPNMPDPPGAPESAVMSVFLWAIPLGQMIVVVTGLSALFLAFMAVRIIMNWIKAL